MITFQLTKDLAKAAELTLTNMRSYYAQYSVESDKAQIEDMTQQLLNWDILMAGKVVGVIRLSFDSEGGYLRDLQVEQQFQNRGIGAVALAEVERLVRASDARLLRLRVFKSSPAVHLYQRHGFRVNNEDDRFYYMDRSLC